jgi:protein prenyltransferase alpha subunit repeat containing protein 1
LECILTSPLHRQSKSPTLWYYRRWIYSTFTPQCEFLFASKSCVLKELEIILKAAEQHQHNYYAFQYARRILDFGILTARQRDKSDSSGTIHDDISDTLYEWCRSHPSDTSGWSLLRTWMEPAYTSPTSQRRIEATLKFGMDMQWKGEAMWSFLRNLAGLDQEYQEGDELDEVTIRIRDAIVEFCPSLDRSSVPRDRGPSG